MSEIGGSECGEVKIETMVYEFLYSFLYRRYAKIDLTIANNDETPNMVPL